MSRVVRDFSPTSTHSPRTAAAQPLTEDGFWNLLMSEQSQTEHPEANPDDQGVPSLPIGFHTIGSEAPAGPKIESGLLVAKPSPSDRRAAKTGDPEPACAHLQGLLALATSASLDSIRIGPPLLRREDVDAPCLALLGSSQPSCLQPVELPVPGIAPQDLLTTAWNTGKPQHPDATEVIDSQGLTPDTQSPPTNDSLRPPTASLQVDETEWMPGRVDGDRVDGRVPPGEVETVSAATPVCEPLLQWNGNGDRLFDLTAWAVGLLSYRGASPAAVAFAPSLNQLTDPQYCAPQLAGAQGTLGAIRPAESHGNQADDSSSPSTPAGEPNVSIPRRPSGSRQDPAAQPPRPELVPSAEPAPPRVVILVVKEDAAVLYVRDYHAPSAGLELVVEHVRRQLMSKSRCVLRVVINGQWQAEPLTGRGSRAD
jgi:hypothetical protein